MLTLGVSGGLDQAFERRRHLFRPGTCHDAAAALVEDGRVVAAIEEERLTRIKHTSKGAVHAIAGCLTTQGIALEDLDQLVYYGTERGCETWMRNVFYGTHDAEPVVTYRQLIHEMLQRGLGQDIEDAKLTFVHHHLAHAISAFMQSGFRESLVVTLDGAGDGLSGSISVWQGERYQVLATIPESGSLGSLYDSVIQMIGYGFTEEYKVMGLAPYGDAKRFKPAFDRLYSLNPDGSYVLHWQLIESLYSLAPVRRRGQPILQSHKDIAAGLQDALERIVMHLLEAFRKRTGLRSLCLAGGVAHNCTLNGKILYSRLFDHVFVQPAAGDAGCAIGAALFPSIHSAASRRRDPPSRIDHVFWGTDIGGDAEVEAALRRWHAVVAFEGSTDIVQRAVELLAAGEVIGWVQGRAEFGPRAFGHRSILADPRPASNKDVVNAMVKKREAFRPFAPAVLEESASEFFELPEGCTSSPFMSFALRVREDARPLLGATTHEDRTARVQTVSRETDPLFWELIRAFGQRTGVPALLNTSFNNHAEPIVDSVDDAVTSFLTTGLHHLVVGNFLVSKRVAEREAIALLAPALPVHARLLESVRSDDEGRRQASYEISNSVDDNALAISAAVHGALRRADGRTRTSELLNGDAGAAAELAALWDRRAIVMRPVD